PLPVAVGSPPWITNPGTIRWKTVPSKKRLRTSETNDAVVLGDVSMASLIEKLPQFVRSVTMYVFAGSSLVAGRSRCRISGAGALTRAQPVFAGAGVVD